MTTTNPFDAIERRLDVLQNLLIEIKHGTPSTPPDIEPFGDFLWLAATCPGIPRSTLRIKSAAGEIPGVVKFGKRILYHKAAVLGWLRAQIRQPLSTPDQQHGGPLEKVDEGEISRRLSKKEEKVKGGERV